MSRLHRHAGTLLMFSGSLMLSLGCSDSSPPAATDGATTATPTTAAGTTAVPTTIEGVSVMKDIEYSSDRPQSIGAVLDVYAPDGAADLPLVMIFHGGGVNKDELQYPLIAQQLAARGFVVVVPTTAMVAGAPPVTDPAGTVVELMDGAACAVSYAVAHGSEWGADPTRIVLFGHSGGGNIASVLGFTYSRAVGDGCAVPAQPWQPQAVVVWDGEIGLINDSIWKYFTTDLPAIFAELTPWTKVAAAIFDGPIHLLVTQSFRAETAVCGDVQKWAMDRDPTGALNTALNVVDTNTDGCVDIGEVHRAFAWRLTQSGVSNDYAEFTAEGTTHDILAPDDVTMLVDLLETTANATLSNTSGQGH